MATIRNPVVNQVCGPFANRHPIKKPAAKGTDVSQRPGAVEREEVGVLDFSGVPLDFVEPAGDVTELRRLQSRPLNSTLSGLTSLPTGRRPISAA